MLKELKTIEDHLYVIFEHLNYLIYLLNTYLPRWYTLIYSNIICFCQGCGSGSLWIRIHFPSWIRIQEGKFVYEIANNCKFIKCFKSKFAQAPLFLTFEQSFMFLPLKKPLHDFFFLQICLRWTWTLDLDPDPHSEKMLDPDPHKMNADPQPWFLCNRVDRH